MLETVYQDAASHQCLHAGKGHWKKKSNTMISSEFLEETYITTLNMNLHRAAESVVLLCGFISENASHTWLQWLQGYCSWCVVWSLCMFEEGSVVFCAQNKQHILNSRWNHGRSCFKCNVWGRSVSVSNKSLHTGSGCAACMLCVMTVFHLFTQRLCWWILLLKHIL